MFAEQNDIDVVRFRNGDRDLVMKIGRTPFGDRALERHAAAIGDAGDKFLPIRSLIPRPLHVGSHGDRTVVCETARPGAPMWTLDRVRRRRAIANALVVARHIHAEGARVERPTPADLAAWIDRPLADVLAVPAAVGLAEPAAHLAVHLREVLDRPLHIAHVHGDYTSHNILVGRAGQVTGVVDWEAAHPRGLPDLDLVQFGMLMEPLAFSLGDLLRSVLHEGRVPEPTRALVTRTHALAPNRLDTRDVLMLAWLAHAGDLLRKSERYSGEWYAHNVVTVLQTWARTSG